MNAFFISDRGHAHKQTSDLNVQLGKPFEYTERLAALAQRQQGIVDALDLTKNQASMKDGSDIEELIHDAEIKLLSSNSCGLLFAEKRRAFHSKSGRESLGTKAALNFPSTVELHLELVQMNAKSNAKLGDEGKFVKIRPAEEHVTARSSHYQEHEETQTSVLRNNMKSHTENGVNLRDGLLHESMLAILMVAVLIICKFLEWWLLHPKANKHEAPPAPVATNAPAKPKLDHLSRECLKAAAICVAKCDGSRGIELLRTRIGQLHNSDLQNEMLQEAAADPSFRPVLDAIHELQVQIYEHNIGHPPQPRN